jgi:deoxyribonuclease-4
MAKSSPLLGTHVSVAGGLYKAIAHGQELNCSAIQIFTHSSRQWAFKPLEKDSIHAFIKAQENSDVQTVVVHASYLMNPASPEPSTRKKSLDMLRSELEACEALKIPYLVLHPGARLESDLATALKNCAETINAALKTTHHVKILLENMAGQGTIVGSSLEELQEIYLHIEEKHRVGFCFDTCHAFASGYDFTTQESYKTFWQRFDDLLGIEKLHAIHMNDSIKAFGSRVDRHADIGSGKIGLHAFELIMNDTRFKDCAKILETPKGEGTQEDQKNLNLLRSLIKK